MARKLPKLQHVKYVTAKGKVYAYFNTGAKKAGRTIYAPMPDPTTTGFLDTWVAMKGARTKRFTAAYTVTDMAREYENSPQFGGLAKNSQEIYSKTLRRIVQHLGKFPVNTLERQHVQAVLDTEMKGPGAYNIFAAVLRALYKWGADRGKTDREPGKGIAKLKTGQHEAWPVDVLDAALASDDELIRLATSLLCFTGQRIGDVLKMRWSDVRKGKVRVVQQKTGKELNIQLLNELQTVLAETPKRGMTIIADEAGRAISQSHLRNALQAFTRGQGVETVPHGLRKNAVNVFLEAQCSIPEVASITGQSFQMVQHYAQQINQQHMAESAVLKLENRRGTSKPIGKQGADSQ